MKVCVRAFIIVILYMETWTCPYPHSFFHFLTLTLTFFHTFTPSPSLGPQSHLYFVLLHLPIGIFNLIFTLVALLLLRRVTTKGNPLHSHGHEGQCPNRKEPYKILYPLGGRPTPSGCTGIDQSEERDPSNITL